MITPINNYQSKVCFNASLKAQKLKQGLMNTSVKIKDFGSKVKDEFKNLDDEAKMYLYKSIILLSVIVAYLSYVSHIVKTVVDKFQALFE